MEAKKSGSTVSEMGPHVLESAASSSSSGILYTAFPTDMIVSMTDSWPAEFLQADVNAVMGGSAFAPPLYSFTNALKWSADLTMKPLKSHDMATRGQLSWA